MEENRFADRYRQLLEYYLLPREQADDMLNRILQRVGGARPGTKPGMERNTKS